MNQQETVASIEARAKSAGLTLGELCRRAGIHPTTFSRWKLTPRNPEPMKTTLDNIEKLEAVLRDAAALPMKRKA